MKVIAWIVVSCCLTLLGLASIYVIRFLFWAWQFVAMALITVVSVIVLFLLWDLVCWSFKTVWRSWKV